jgi:hypothetical protein
VPAKDDKRSVCLSSLCLQPHRNHQFRGTSLSGRQQQ